METQAEAKGIREHYFLAEQERQVTEDSMPLKLRGRQGASFSVGCRERSQSR